MKNKGFLSRSRLGDSVAHKVVTPSLNPVTEITTPIAAPQLETEAGSGSDIRAVSRTAGPRADGSRRYTLNLHVPESAAEGLGRHLDQFPPSRRAAMRRALVCAFIAEVQSGTQRQMGTASDGLVQLRVDLRLADPLRDALLARANALPFEPKASALARYLAPLLALFISTHLDTNPTAAMPNTETLP